MKKYIWIFIFLLAFILRVYQLDKVPPGFSNDEISIAYNAYSIMETGKDEYGQNFPISFRSHNTYKAPVLIYLAAPLTKILGNHEWAIRLPSAVLGSITVIFLGLIIHELTKNLNLSLWSSFVLATAPWHIYTSRIGFESSVALFFLSLGVYLFFLSLRVKNWLLILSFIFFAISIYSYHTEWVFTPILILLLVAFNFKKINKRRLFTGVLLFLTLILPLTADVTVHLGDTTRASTEILFNDPKLGVNLHSSQNWMTSFVITFKFWINRYLSYFNPQYIFFNGLPIPDEFSQQRFGLLLFTAMPLFFLGVFALFKDFKLLRNLMFSWLLIGALVPSFTLGDVNLVRNLVSVIPWVVIIALGCLELEKRFPNVKNIRIFLIITLSLNLILFLHNYFVHFPIESSEQWSYGFKQMASYIQKNGDKYQEIIIDPNYGVLDHQLVGVPSLFILYFNNIDPQQYLLQKQDTAGQLKFDKITIRPVVFREENIKPGRLYITGVRNTPIVIQPVSEVYTISLLDGSRAFSFYESR